MGALSGIRVLDLSRAVPGPYCTMLLADLGADVLLVEELVHDGGGPERERDAALNALRRGKRSIGLNLKHPEAQRVFRALAADADVVLEGYRPGVAKRLGVDYATLSATNARLVYCSLSGYGQTGPYASLPGHDLNYVAMAGALGMIGRPGAPPAIPMNLVADLAGGGLMAAFSILAALFSRERSGRGQHIDLAMTDGVLSLLTRAASQWFAGGPMPRPGADRITGALPHYDIYECKDGRWLSVAPLEPKFLRALYEAIGEPALAGIGEASPPEAREHAREVLRTRFLDRTRDEWFALLREKDTCVAPVYDLAEVFADPHHRARGMLAEVTHPALGALKQVGVGPKFSETPGEIRSLGAPPGAHTVDVLRELGHGDDAIAALREAGAIA